MGSYVSSPITEKESTDECNEKVVCGASSMQGWRLSQEDAHNCILDYDANTSFFAVYDGHGGHEVAQYCAENLPGFIKESKEYKENKIEDALSLGFLRFDATIATPEVVKILRKMEGRGDTDEEEEEENVNNLYEEAAMPIEQVIEKYTANLTSKKEDKAKDKNECDATVGTSFSSVACSSSSSVCEKTFDGVSSSSEAQSSEKNCDENKNGDANLPESSVSNSTQADSTPNFSTDDVPIQNGEISTPSEEQHKNDVTSSSTPVENGTPSKKGKGKAVVKPEVKKAVNTRPKRSAQQLYKNWLDFGEESEDSSDEEDQTFEGPNDESSEEEEGVNVAIDVSEESSEEEEEDEEESDDEEEGDERSDEANRAIARSLKGEPGSDSGCTAVVALLRDNQLYVANAGDSRCVVCRNGKAVDMSIDHKPEDEPEMQRIIAAGGEVTSDGRVNGGLNLSRAIGDHAYKKNKDLPDREQMISALPDIKTLTIDLNQDEFMVLACDGIWNSMSSQEVVDFVRPRIMDNREKLSTICEEIFDHCLAPHTVRDGTGCDNMTAVIVKFKSNSNKRPISPHPDENEAKRTKTEPVSEAQVDTTI